MHKKYLSIIILILIVSFLIPGCSNLEETTQPITTQPAIIPPPVTPIPSMITTTFITITRSVPATATLPEMSSTPAAVAVDELYNGKEINLTIGGSLQVALNSNPSTGFKWELSENSDPTVLEKVSNIFETPMVKRKEGEPPLVGAGGKEFWNFKALKKGKSVLSMEYSRPWEGGEKGVNKFSLTVIVE
jgi:inhibitor of cysteine peptidase